jgi:hypothetical protein
LIRFPIYSPLSSCHICTIQRANGKVNLSGFKSIDTAVLNLISHRHGRTWSIRLDDHKDDTITIKFMDQPEAVEGGIDHRCKDLGADKATSQRDLFVNKIVELFACDNVTTVAQSGPMYWFTVSPQFITMEETEVLNGLPGGVVLGVDIVVGGVCIKYNMESDTRNNPRKLKSSEPGLFTRRLDAKSRRMCGKGLPPRKSRVAKHGARIHSQQSSGVWAAVCATLGM